MCSPPANTERLGSKASFSLPAGDTNHPRVAASVEEAPQRAAGPAVVKEVDGLDLQAIAVVVDVLDADVEPNLRPLSLLEVLRIADTRPAVVVVEVLVARPLIPHPTAAVAKRLVEAADHIVEAGHVGEVFDPVEGADERLPERFERRRAPGRRKGWDEFHPPVAGEPRRQVACRQHQVAADEHARPPASAREVRRVAVEDFSDRAPGIDRAEQFADPEVPETVLADARQDSGQELGFHPRRAVGVRSVGVAPLQLSNRQAAAVLAEHSRQRRGPRGEHLDAPEDRPFDILEPFRTHLQPRLVFGLDDQLWYPFSPEIPWWRRSGRAAALRQSTLRVTSRQT